MSLISNWRSLFAVKRKWLIFLFDTVAFSLVFFVTLGVSYLTADSVNRAPLNQTVANVLIFWGCLVVCRFLFGVYSQIWRYANVLSYTLIIFSDGVAGCIGHLITILLGINFSVWYSVSNVTIFCLGTLFARLIYKLIYRSNNLREAETDEGGKVQNKIGVAIVGAGQVGAILANELLYNTKLHYQPICFIDRNPDKIGSIINGLRVYGEGKETLEMLKTMPVQEIFLALPNVSGEDIKALYEYYGTTGCKVKLYDFPINMNDADAHNGKRVIREFHIEDLLFRDAIKVENHGVSEYYGGKVVLVTGGGGSIGSELCRQIAKHKPKKLVVLDIYENNAYTIQQELIQRYGASLDLEVEIASVRDRIRLDAIFAHYRPQVVFHAAAHKHVPLMEHSSCEAVKNNVLGTYNVADMAEKYGVEKFILISTDKAVNPTNVMGASKRMCEYIIQCRADSKTSFAAVRFGNVLGSNGSVVPLFRTQIERGGPVTLTDKRIIRYFMTISEASQLVVAAGLFAKSGELFVLDMGKPVKILDLAENMIRLSGLTPYVDIDIIETGLRPGEKLYEELLIKTEKLSRTENRQIFVEKDTPLSRAEVDMRIDMLCKAVKECENSLDQTPVVRAMKSAVPTYIDPNEVNRVVGNSAEKFASSNVD